MNVIPGLRPQDFENFARQWRKFGTMHQRNWEEFFDLLSPVAPEDFRGKLVLDAGCGSGRFTLIPAVCGARLSVGIDISEAVEVAARETRSISNVQVMQADLLRLPFRGETFDIIYSIGVLHHLPDPEQGFRTLVECLRPGGRVFVWVYAREGNLWFTRIVDPMRERVTSRLPFKVVSGLSWPVALVAFAVVTPLRLVASRSRLIDRLLSRLPLWSYLRYISTLGFRTTWATIIDKLTPRFAHYLSGEELRAWFTRAGLEEVVLSHRNNNSWRAQAWKPAVPSARSGGMDGETVRG